MRLKILGEESLRGRSRSPRRQQGGQQHNAVELGECDARSVFLVAYKRGQTPVLTQFLTQASPLFESSPRHPKRLRLKPNLTLVHFPSTMQPELSRPRKPMTPLPLLTPLPSLRRQDRAPTPRLRCSARPRRLNSPPGAIPRALQLCVLAARSHSAHQTGSPLPYPEPGFSG